MSFFFNKSESDENLQYDDTAFMHFTLSICAITVVIFISLIKRDYSIKGLKGLRRIQKMPIFKQKIKNTQQKTKSYFVTFSFWWKFIIILLGLIIGFSCYMRVEEGPKMIGFDPHQILGVDTDASVNVIKKAYRKLALIYHPDRNSNNPQAASKFIQISKAYQCLTDQQAKEKCAKYGNPDGQSSFKVGIGLPKFMVQAGNQYMILIPIFFFLLVVIPRTFISWSNRIKPKDEAGILIANYPIMHSFFSPKFRVLTCPILMGCMKQLDVYFSDKKTLTQEEQKGFKALLLRTDTLTQDQLKNIQSHILYRCFKIYAYMCNKQKDARVVEVFPQLCHKMILFSCFYAQRMMQGQHLGGNPNMEITWYGLEPTRSIYFFLQQMFNQTLRLGDVKSIQFLDLTPEQIQIAKNNEISNLHKNLLNSDQKIDAFVNKFPQANRKYIQQQIKCLPAFEIQTKVLLGDQQVTSMTVDDFANLQIILSQKRDSPGYVTLKDYSMLVKQNFYMLLSYNSNLMFFAPFNTQSFKDGKLVFNIQHRQNVERDMKFKVEILLPYPKMNLQSEICVDVIAHRPDNQIIINKQDLDLEKMPKNFFESLASMQTYNQSDNELSDGQDSEQEGEKKKNNKFQQEQCGVNCGHKH